MTHQPVAGGDSGYVVCVGLSLSQVSEIARLLRGQGVVLATADTEGARALLGPPTERSPGAAAPRAVSVVPADPVPAPSGPGVPRAVPVIPIPLHDAEGAGAQRPPRLPLETATQAIPRLREQTRVPDDVPPAAAPPSPRGARPPSAPLRGSVARVPAIRRHRQAPSLTGNLRPSAGVEQAPLAQALASRAAPLVRGPLMLDPATREVTAHGRRIHLSVREFDLLAVLASRVDRVWSFAELTATVWNSEYLGDPDHVTSAVKRLRKRLTAVHDLEVASVRGVGYRLMVPS